MTVARFVELVSVEQEPLRRFLLALCCGNRAMSEDIAQETMIKAYLAVEKFDEKVRFSTWLTRIAYNTFIDWKRKDKYALQPIDETIQVMGEGSADSQFDYQELYTALDELPPKERSAILLFYLQGYAIKEIANIIDSSEDAVKKQLSRGREHLKKLIER